MLPPGLFIFCFALGTLAVFLHHRYARPILLTSVTLLYLMSIPSVGDTLLRSLESYPPLQLQQTAQQQGEAIVVLGGGHAESPEYQGDTVSAYTLERLRYAARLARRTKLPVLASGGVVFGDHMEEAVLMRDTLEIDFDVPVKWIEPRSRTTWENAKNSAEMLKAANIERVYLVTHAWHMKRAVYAFEQYGIQVTPAPTIYTMPRKKEGFLPMILPGMGSLRNTHFALHEWIGLLWYKTKSAMNIAV